MWNELRHLAIDKRKDDITYWQHSFEYHHGPSPHIDRIRDEYVGHHYDFYKLSQVAQAAMRGDIEHSLVTQFVLDLIGVADDPGDTEVPPNWRPGDASPIAW